MIDQYRRYRESKLRQLDRNNDFYDEDPVPRIPRRSVASTRHEHSDVFESLCVEAELDDMVGSYPYSPTIRRGSLQHTTYANQDDVNFGTRGHRRRHSSYNTNNRAAHRQEHQVMKEYILTRGDTLQEERLIFIDNLYDLSNGLRLLGGLPDTNIHSTEAYPILNYVLDFDDDDSIDMAKSKRKKPNSLSNQDDSHDFICDESDVLLPNVDNQANYVEYIMDLPPAVIEDVKSIAERRRRKVPSYQTLQKQMESQPISTLVKSMIHTCQNSRMHSTETTSTPSPQTLSGPKVCDNTNNNHTNESYPISNKPTMLTHIQCARGA